MSDDVSGATVQLSTHVAEKAVDAIAKLLQALLAQAQAARQGKPGEVKSSDMTNLRPGENGIAELIAEARRNGEGLVSSDNLTKADTLFIKAKAREYGMAVAFTGKEGEVMAAHAREGDKAILTRIEDEMVQSKLASRPQELGNFEVKGWEIPHIKSELTKYGLCARFGKTKDGKHFILYEKEDEKAIKLAHREYVRKAKEVEGNLTIEQNTKDNDFIVIRDGDGQISFGPDDAPSRGQLSALFRRTFGYDENKAAIACGKYGEQCLKGDGKKAFFGADPRADFAQVESHVGLRGESVLVKDYDCLRLTLKEDEIPRLVYRDGESGRFAVLTPETMTRGRMAALLRDNLGISNEKTLDALTDKAERVADYYQRQGGDNHSHTLTLEGGLPYGGVETEIERDKDTVSVTSTSRLKTLSGEGGEIPFHQGQRQLELALSDKKKALAKLREMYEAQGVPADIAKRQAREVFNKAQAQSPEKVLYIEEIRADSNRRFGDVTLPPAATATVRYGAARAEVNPGDPEAAAETIRQLGAPEGQAAKAREKSAAALGRYLSQEVDFWKREKAESEGRGDADSAVKAGKSVQYWERQRAYFEEHGRLPPRGDSTKSAEDYRTEYLQGQKQGAPAEARGNAAPQAKPKPKLAAAKGAAKK
jgi:hypothetical protein